MIKRRFYKLEHGDKDAPSDSSSSSDSELDAAASVDSEEVEEDDDNVVVESRKKDEPSSSSSGYESEDSSGNEVNLDSADSPSNDDGSEDEDYKQEVNGTRLLSENHYEMANTEDAEADNEAKTSNVLDCVLKSKSRHARSEKLLKEGRLKKMLNSDGEIEDGEDGETHQERHAKILALAESNKNAKKNKGRQRQKKRKALKKKPSDDPTPKSTKKSSNKKRRKSDI
ncbi:hypothetical protein CTI12_AA002330 [Artemisia annua]|uniref:Uncharacterized protein n=1 Tax=Artemisia annua TaxID=35608 RepID=A0A2U1QNW6_ARTAN|nr:hypothetical protein CTI12_AA002330 [Artemisia annua]